MASSSKMFSLNCRKTRVDPETLRRRQSARNNSCFALNACLLADQQLGGGDERRVHQRQLGARTLSAAKKCGRREATEVVEWEGRKLSAGHQLSDWTLVS